MELIVEPCYALPCELETFTINGKAADSSDFGDTFDHNEKRHYGCGDIIGYALNISVGIDVHSKYAIIMYVFGVMSSFYIIRQLQDINKHEDDKWY